MKKHFFVALLTLLLSACMSFDVMEQTLPKLIGQRVDVATKYLGIPKAKYTIDKQEVYVWSSVGNYTSTVMTPSSTVGQVGGAPFSSYSTGFSSQTQTLGCEIKVLTEKKVIKQVEYDGNNLPCLTYAERLRPLLEAEKPKK